MTYSMSLFDQFITKKVFLKILIATLILSSRCTKPKEMLISHKNECYEDKLNNLRTTTFYKQIQSSFADTFPVFQKDHPSLLKKRVDEAVFLKRDSLQCLLVVLERDDNKEGSFGSARTYNGKLTDGKWIYKRNMWFVFSHNYYKKYPENSFKNISQLARYSILTEGSFSVRGCELDEDFWFEKRNTD